MVSVRYRLTNISQTVKIRQLFYVSVKVKGRKRQASPHLPVSFILPSTRCALYVSRKDTLSFQTCCSRLNTDVPNHFPDFNFDSLHICRTGIDLIQLERLHRRLVAFIIKM